LVVSNLLYPVVAVGVAALLCVLIVLRHRRPKSVEANMRAFHKGLRALAPEGDNPVAGSSAPRRPAQRSATQRPPTPRPVPQRRVEQRRPATPGAIPRQASSAGSDGSNPGEGVEAETG
jgi:hypothetical protein